MKKILMMLLVVILALGAVACGTEPELKDDPAKKSEGVNTHAEYVAAEKGDALVIEAYVQAKQSWWDNKASIYAQDMDGGYFIYEAECTEEVYNKLTPGTKIKVTGYKTEWAGEMEIDSGATIEILDGNYVAPAFDVTSILANETELIKHQNKVVVIKGVTVKNISFKGGEPGDDIYVNVTLADKDYSFCVERYLTGPETEVYKTVSALKAGDVVDIGGLLYWYEGVNTHITSVEVKAAYDPSAKSEGVNTHAEYVAAEKGDALVIEAFVQAKQSWWDNKASIYAQDGVGGYFIYEAECTEELYNKLTPGTKIKVTGYKTEWAGEMEIDSGATIEIVDGYYLAPIEDVTDILANEAELIKHQNEYVAINGVTVKSIEYKGGEPGDDIYVTVTLAGDDYSFCVERYLTGPETEVYKAVGNLKEGDVIDVEGYLYWYESVNTHITSVTVK